MRLLRKRLPLSLEPSLALAAFVLLALPNLVRPLFSQQPGVSSPIASQSLPPRASVSAVTADSPYRITGVVVDTVTKSPIANATLIATPITTIRPNRSARRQSQNQADSVTTDAQGHFDLPVISAGGWELTAAAHGYRTESLDEHSGFSTAVILTEAAPQFNVTFRLTPASIIQGYVLDEAGEPVRGATVALSLLPPPSPENQHHLPQSLGQQTTDDRGFYKFTALSAGSYHVRVSATPWYATSSPNLSFNFSMHEELSAGDPTATAPDSLDVVYPALWFPGTTDPSSATPVKVRGGDTQQADFRLLPVPGSHLHIPAPPADGPSPEHRPATPMAYLTRLLADGSEDQQQTTTRVDSQGNVDISGLSPGTYLVHQQSPGSNVLSLSTIQVGAGSPRTLELGEAVPAPTVTIYVDPAADQDSLQISFRNVETGYSLYAQRLQDLSRTNVRHRSRAPVEPPGSQSAPSRPPRTVGLPPGKYEIFLNGVRDLHLSSIEATEATAVGRTVTITSGSPKLFIHTSSGFGTVTGRVAAQGQPDAGAMVLLIPATLGSPSGLDLPSRDQSNSDGSFEMGNLLPGGYILVAIDHGWDVNWSDPATLRRFLVHGAAVEVKAGSDLKQTIEAQSP